MANRPVVLCKVLCFAVNKYGKTAVKLLKSSLTDFYSDFYLKYTVSQKKTRHQTLAHNFPKW